jgi:porin
MSRYVALPLLVLATVAYGAVAKAGNDAPPNYAETTITGDWGGYRSRLHNEGVTLTITQTSDFLGNVSGGLRTGAAYDGVFELQGDFDMDRLAGWVGGKIHVSGYSIQGEGLSERDLGNLLTVTSVEANDGLRLGELYLSQSFIDNKVTLKLGQILADQNVAISNTAGLFVNSTFGWPGLFATDLPGGGPAYPFAVPGIQVIVTPDDAWTLQAAIFNGSPTGSTSNGNANGLGFPVGNGILAVAEAEYAYTPGPTGHGLPGTYKVGAWFNTEKFDSLSTASNGVSLADPQSSGRPHRLSGDFAIYAIADQTLWQEPADSDSGLNGFVRAAIAPGQDRNIINWYLDMGLAYKGLVRGRDNDTVGVAFAYANIGGVADLARARNTFEDDSDPIPNSEAVVEVTYQAAITPSLTIQPFFEYVIRPGGNAPNPNKPNSSIQDAAVFGIRTAATF